ncbi:MAG TPA: hypothetical protein VM689_00450 [Aliidongia sp.]|nr:hypothetical protein [Aliidongia sp.]
MILIPIVELGEDGPVELARRMPEAARAALSAALSAHPALPILARLGDRLTRRWLERGDDPYAPEIAEIAGLVDLPGAWLLNCVYEWACATSAGPDPAGRGARLVRLLDWGMPGLGRRIVVARRSTRYGPFDDITWPGYVGTLTASAPGRFAAAINQAPRQAPIGIRSLDEIAVRIGMLRRPGTIPLSHFLRHIFETAPDWDTALALLTAPEPEISAPGFVILAGTRPQEYAVIELLGRRRRLHQGDGMVGVANDWLAPGFPGVPRPPARAGGEKLPAPANNRLRRGQIMDCQAAPFTGAERLPAPVLNANTVLAVEAVPASGALLVEGLERKLPADVRPRVVARVRTRPSPVRLANSMA